MSADDSRSVEGYSLIHGEESWGSKGSFGLKIFVKDSERDKLEIPVNRHGRKVKFATDGDRKAAYDAARILIVGIRGSTERLKPDFVEKVAKQKEYYKGLFLEAGITTIYMQELPNGYCPDGGWCCLDKPWFKVTTPFGHITIGWRKSVINIDWEESDIPVSGKELFPEENVTRGDYGDHRRFIHAHGNQAAVNYLKRLHEEAKHPRPVKETEE